MTTAPQIGTDQHDAAEPHDEYNEDFIPQFVVGPMQVHVPENYIDPSPLAVDPAALPRLMRVECGAESLHEPMWMEYDDEAWYPPGCPRCWYEAMRDAHAGCAHSRHGSWRRWKLSHWLASWAYRLGLIASYGCTWDGHCNGCMSGFRWRLTSSRPYVLGWPAWKWGCLLKNRHWPGGYVGFDCCTKCLPCPECGSTAENHDVLHQSEQPSSVPVDETSDGGRHRLSESHPGWESAPEELEALLRAQRGQ